MKIRFDDSLPKLVEVLTSEIGKDSLSKGVVIRDIGGRLSFVSALKLPAKIKTKLANLLVAELGCYARPDRVIASVEDAGAKSLLADKDALVVCVMGCSVHLIDRRLVGADWLRSPAPKAPPSCSFCVCEY